MKISHLECLADAENLGVEISYEPSGKGSWLILTWPRCPAMPGHERLYRVPRKAVIKPVLALTLSSAIEQVVWFYYRKFGVPFID